MNEKNQNENPRVGQGEQNKSSDIQGKRASVKIVGAKGSEKPKSKKKG
jgi:hypothetical protein